MNPNDERPDPSARDSESLLAIERLSARLAHDFNNVLQIIGGNLQLLKGAVNGNAAAERRLASATEGVARGTALTAALQTFAGRHDGAPERLVVARELARIEPELRTLVGDRITLAIEPGDESTAILADPQHLGNALRALVANACDAMPEGGALSIRAEALSGSRHVLLTVSDSGSGMTDEVRSRAREPFFSTKPRDQANGLGLSFVHGFARQRGGWIEIESGATRGATRGTTIRIVIPAADAEVDAVGPGAMVDAPRATAQQGGEPAPSSATSSLTILYVEDNTLLQRSTMEYFEDLGYRVVATTNAEDALANLAEREFDVLFTDISLPGMSGLDLARVAKPLRPAMRLVLASGYGRQFEVRQIREQLGPDIVFLPKPFDLAELDRVLRDIASTLETQRSALHTP